MLNCLKIRNRKNLLIGLIIIFIFLNSPVLADTSLLPTPTAPGARLFLLPDKTSYLNPNNLILNVIVDPEQKSFNAAEIIFDFPTDLIKINKIDYIASSCPIAAEEIIDNQNGRARFSCGTSTRALNFKTAIARITFNKTNSGWAKINLNRSSVLAADGLGTNILNSTEIHNLLIIK